MFVIPHEVTGGLPIKVWGNPEDRASGDVWKQALNLARLPVARKWIGLMPDYHMGYGMPIGGVLATEGAVVPNAVGVDIGCGMIAIGTPFAYYDLSRDTLKELQKEIYKRVPVGQSHQQQKVKHGWLEEWSAKFAGSNEALDEYPVIAQNIESVYYQMGTLGGGNHFIEIQRDQMGQVWVMIHSGSRNVGLQVCNHYHKIAKSLMETYYTKLPDPDLSFLPQEHPAYYAYMRQMEWCMRFAEFNRAYMLGEVMASFRAIGMPWRSMALSAGDFIETHHNFARMEHHYGSDYLIHRKGAVHAKGYVTIPGSMGTKSYIGIGKENPESFATCSHGAGRILGRKQANAAITHEDAVASMKHVVYGTRQGDYDEHPHAYKDIDAVMAQQLDLVTPDMMLSPMMVVKG